MGDKFRISIEPLENGFEVSVPDMEEIAKAQADAKKNASKNGGMISPYIGDMTKDYAAKSVKEVIALVTTAIENMPTSEKEFDAAFEEASGGGESD